MPTGALTAGIDVAQVVLYVFWFFFAGLIYYLHRENKREGYPLVSDRSEHITVQGFPPVPAPKTYILPHGAGTVQAPCPSRADRREPALRPAANFPGAPFVPTGDAMRDGVGAASYAERADHPDVTFENHIKIRPLRMLSSPWSVESGSPDPRGMRVVGADGVEAGKVTDVWIDQSEYMIRYLEVALNGDAGTVLVPMPLVRLRREPKGDPSKPLSERLIDGRPRRVEVASILGSQFAYAPRLANPEQITLLEEDKVSAYFGGGHLHATPERAEPLL
jgi:photosynthetic reaction center H subunit